MWTHKGLAEKLLCWHFSRFYLFWCEPGVFFHACRVLLPFSLLHPHSQPLPRKLLARKYAQDTFSYNHLLSGDSLTKILLGCYSSIGFVAPLLSPAIAKLQGIGRETTSFSLPA